MRKWERWNNSIDIVSQINEKKTNIFRRRFQCFDYQRLSSSSLKYQLMNPETGDVAAKGLCERIYIDGRLTHKVGDKKVVKDIPMPTHSEAIAAVLDILVDPVDGADQVR